MLYLDWFTLTGVVAFLGIAGVLVYFCRTGGCHK